MQVSLIDLLHEDNILLGVQAEDAAGAIRALAESLMASGIAEEGYAADAIAREETFPTGLPTQPIAVAIPHADPQHVLHSGVAVGLLAQPVTFGQMGTDGSTRVEASVVFLLAIREKEKQVEMIGQLVALIRSGDFLEQLTIADSPRQALELVQLTVANS